VASESDPHPSFAWVGAICYYGPMIRREIHDAIEKAIEELGFPKVDFAVEHPADLAHGDYATNVALILGGNPPENADEIKKLLEAEPLVNFVEKIEVVGPGFINFTLSDDARADVLFAPPKEELGGNDTLKGQKIIIEYTDPNPFKEFHIGHLMSNAIGESLSRLIEFSGAEVKRANYQGDVGVHVAKAIWGKQQNSSLTWGDAYATGAQAYDTHKEEIDALNKTIYEKSDSEVNALYEQGRKETLEGFEKMYALLGTTFDEYFFESEAAPRGKEVVEKNVDKVFARGESGALVFHGEERDPRLHTRVFVNAHGIPTYEAKELALAQIKYERYQYDRSVVITGNEVDGYFKVVHAAMREVYPELAQKTEHHSHGMLRLPTGKMSSRTGSVITAMSLINEAKSRVLEKTNDGNDKIANEIAVGALKYAILKQAPGKDIIFDMEQALSLEGDSGPYLQYTAVRAGSLLAKGKGAGFAPQENADTLRAVPQARNIVRLAARFSDIVEDAMKNSAPQTVVHYLLSLASEFNSWYAQETIVVEGDSTSSVRLGIVSAVRQILENGLWTLGIKVPERM